MEKRSNTEVFKQLQSSDRKSVDAGLTYLYQLSKQKVKNFVLQSRGNSQDVDDVFHDGLIAFYNMVRADKLDSSINIDAYLFTICKHIWLKKRKRILNEVDLDAVAETQDEQAVAVDTLLEGEQKVLIEEILNRLGEECRKILLLYYYERLRMKEIVKVLEYSNDQVLRNKKSKCMKTLRQIVLASAFYQKQLLDQ